MNTVVNPPSLLVDRRGAAAMLGISVSLLDRLTKAGEIPCVRLHSRVMYRPTTLTAWLAECESTGRNQPVKESPCA